MFKNVFKRSFFTYRVPVKNILERKNKKLNNLIANKIYATEKNNIYDCEELIKKHDIRFVPIVDEDEKIIGVLNKFEIEKYTFLQQFHDDEDYKNWLNNSGKH